MTARRNHPHSRPLPGPASEPAFITAAQGLVGTVLLDQVIAGATPQKALLTAARELIRQAQEINRIMPAADGGPRFTRVT